MTDKAEPGPIVSARDVKVHFGAVKALDGVSLVLAPGECIGLVGHNGAGKSTIVNVINGALEPHAGTLAYSDGDEGRRGIAAARAAGIRCVFQELSLCPNLSIVENVRIMHRDLKGAGWRKRARSIIAHMLDEIFPGHRIDGMQTTGSLSLAERQMVEIAIAFASVDAAPRLVILDEPTSSLDAGLAAQLLEYVRRFVAGGGSVLLISHILGEILSTAGRIVVMKDGKVAADRPAGEFTTQTLVQAMGSVVKEQVRGQGRKSASDAPEVAALPARADGDIGFVARAGEIVGLAGLAGHGQTRALLDLFAKGTSNWLPGKGEDVAFVAGDRTLNGVFPLWSILKNLSIASLRSLSRLGYLNEPGERQRVSDWRDKIEIRTPDIGNRILSLSGGNQQKVLFARALATPARTILMDDPMRGVDIGTKQEVYAMLRAEQAKGRTFVWYSTEMDEICLCDRVYVFCDGKIVAELVGDDISEEKVLAASFMEDAA